MKRALSAPRLGPTKMTTKSTTTKSSFKMSNNKMKVGKKENMPKMLPTWVPLYKKTQPRKLIPYTPSINLQNKRIEKTVDLVVKERE